LKAEIHFVDKAPSSVCKNKKKKKNVKVKQDGTTRPKAMPENTELNKKLKRN